MRTQLLLLLLAPLVLTSLIGCGGASTEINPPTVDDSTPDTYNGPSARNSDVTAFRLSLWDNLKADNRCGGACHVAGGQAPAFVRQDDINLAYDAAIGYVNLASPASSAIVSKVAGGHNCWLTSNAACAATLTAYIEIWAGDEVSGARAIELEAPPIKAPGASKSFPDAPGLFTTSIHPLLVAHCDECHAESSPTPQVPYISNADANSAYIASRDKIDLDNPANSRLVVRLREEFHNCWSDCQDDADEMQAAIATFANDIPLTEVDPQLVLSKALNLGDGTVASGGSRHESNQVALYEFKTGSGSTAFDTSGVEPALNLNLSGDYSWVDGWGIEFRNGKAQGQTSSSQKLAALIRSTGEYSIEAWVTPANVTQTGPARIISYSAGTGARNFTLGQSLYNYEFLHRSSTTDVNGEPSLATDDDDEDLQATQQHVVVTFDPVNGRRIYVNGQDTGDRDSAAAGNMADWDDSFALIFGNEASGDRPWAGKLRMVAIHNRALTQAQIEQNFGVGVGQKFFLLFNVSDHVAVPDSYIVFEAAMYDSYSYLFTQPRYVTLHPTERPNGVAIGGIRIGINGREAKVGQAFDKVSTSLDSSQYDAESGQLLSRLGTTIPLEKGLDSDEFFLTFELLGASSNVFVEAVPTPPAPPADAEPQPDIGLRTFDEINASMAAITGVSPVESSVSATFETIRQQLPSVEGIEGFLSSHQVAVAQLAIEYCSALVDNTTLRNSFFPGFDFNVNANSVADATWESQVVTPLINKMVGQNLDSQPLPTDIRDELMDLLTETADLKPYIYDINGDLVSNPDGNPDGLARCGGPCSSDRTEIATKAACAATLGSAVVLLQ